MKILLVEPLLSQQEHLAFNAGIIENISCFSPEAELIVLANKGYCDKLQEILGDKDRLRFYHLFEINQANKILTSIILVLNFIKFWIYRLRFKPQKILFFTIEFTIFPMLLVFFGKIFKNDINFIIHQSLPLTRANWLKGKMLSFFLNKNKFHFIFLSKTVLDQVLGKYKVRTANIWQHPILDNLSMSRTVIKDKPNDKYKLLLFGKQFDNLTKSNLNELLSKIADFNSSSDVLIELTMPENEIIGYEKLDFLVGISSTYLTKGNYLSLLSSHHFILFLNDIWSEIRASGVAMDAINLDTPLVAPDMGFFSDLKQFSKHEYAYLFDPSEKLGDILTDFFNKGLDQYKHYIIGCKELRSNLSINQTSLLNCLL